MAVVDNPREVVFPRIAKLRPNASYGVFSGITKPTSPAKVGPGWLVACKDMSLAMLIST